MSLRTSFRSFLLVHHACTNGKRRAFGFANLMAAFNGISDRNLRWFLAELSDSDGITPNNARRLRRMSYAIKMAGQERRWTKDDPDFAVQRRVYKNIRTRRAYNFVKTQFMVALREQKRQEAANS